MTCYVLDTDHLSLYERRHSQVSDRILRVRQNSIDVLHITVVSVEEQYRIGQHPHLESVIAGS